jgi:hypothetical protein
MVVTSEFIERPVHPVPVAAKPKQMVVTSEFIERPVHPVPVAAKPKQMVVTSEFVERPVQPVPVAAKPKKIRVVSVETPAFAIATPQSNQIRAIPVSLAGPAVYPVVAAKEIATNPMTVASFNDGFWGVSGVEQSSPPAKKKQKKQHTPGFDLESLTIYELKSELSKRQLKVSGNKDELIFRLNEFERWNSLSINELKCELTGRHLHVSGGNKRDLVDLIIKFEEYDSVPAYELKSVLSERGLSTAGNGKNS